MTSNGSQTKTIAIFEKKCVKTSKIELCFLVNFLICVLRNTLDNPNPKI